VLNESGEVIAQATSDDKGNFLLDMSEYGNLQAFPSSPNLHTKDSVSINIPVGFLGERHVQLYLDESLVTIEVVDDSTMAPVDHPVYYIKQLNSKNTLTPLLGDHSYQYQPGHTYEIFATAHGYFSARDTLETSTELVESFTHRVKLNKVVVGERIRLDHIYYDLNSAKLREESMVELDKVVKFLEDNAELKIELSSHTDSRGSDAYNLQLSQKRAESATNYLLSKGIEKSRIVPKGYGESKLVNRCVNGEPCSAEEHQANRRTELKIL
ncbi:MAG: OmpA family protein, partial [Marinoscillum sp.]